MKNTMEDRELKQRWKDETSERKDSIVEFIKDYFENRRTQRQEENERIEEYDSFTELHFSGSNFDVLAKEPLKNTASQTYYSKVEIALVFS